MLQQGNLNEPGYIPPHLRLKYNPQFHCGKCRLSFMTLTAKLEHMEEKLKAGVSGHHACRHCSEAFYTFEAKTTHLRKEHPLNQKLICPGCHAGPFQRTSQLICHLEKGSCPNFNAEKLDQMREDKMKFARQLTSLTGQPLKHDFSKHLPSHASIREEKKFSQEYDRKQAAIEANNAKSTNSTNSNGKNPLIRPGTHEWLGLKPPVSSESYGSTASTSQSQSGQSQTNGWGKQEQQPHGGDRKQVINIASKTQFIKPSTYEWLQLTPPISSKSHGATIPISQSQSSQSQTSAWGKQMQLPRDTPATLLPTQQQQPQRPQQQSHQQQPKATTSLMEELRYGAMDIDCPDHPCFNPEKYKSPYSNKYNCPKVGCPKMVKTVNGIRLHLNSEAHSDQRYMCPTCCKHFRSLTAVTAHMESESTRCNIRKAKDLDAYVDQLSGGLVEVQSEKNEDGTNKYDVKKDAESRIVALGSGNPFYEQEQHAIVLAKMSDGWGEPIPVDDWSDCL